MSRVLGIFRATPLEGAHVVRATFPMPRETPTWTRGRGGYYPCRVFAGSTPLRTQVEVCRRDAFGEPAVIEVLAAVPKGLLTWATPFDFEVREEAASSFGAPDPGEGVWDLVLPYGAMGLRLRDADGRVYRSSLTGLQHGGSKAPRWERFGPVAITGMRPTWLTHKPNGSSGEMRSKLLPYAGAAQAFISVGHRLDAIELLLNFHNAAIPLVGDLHFDSLELAVPDGWRVTSEWDDPHVGEAYLEGGHRVYPLVAPLEGGRMNLLDMMRERHWRLVVHREGGYQPEGGRSWGVAIDGTNAEGEDLASWGSPLSPRYLVQCATAPTDLEHLRDDIAEEAVDERQRFAKAWNSPTTGAENAGYLQFRSGKYGGWTGGWDITPWIRPDILATGSVEGKVSMEIEFCRYAARQRGLYASGGLPVNPENHLDGEGKPGWNIYNERWQPGGDGPFGYFAAGDGNRVPELDAPYRSILKGDPSNQYDHGIDPIDGQHHIRCDKAAKFLATVGNDPLAKLYLYKAATMGRMEAMETEGGDLREVLEQLARNPARGFGGFGRETGWKLDVMVNAYAFGDDDCRERFLPWIVAQCDALRWAQTPSGMFAAKTTGKVADQEPFPKPARYGVTRPNEELYIGFALLGAHNSVFGTPFPDVEGPLPENAAPVREAILKLCAGFWSFAWRRAQDGTNPANGNFQRLAVRDIDGPGYSSRSELPWDIQTQVESDSYQSALIIPLGLGLEGYNPKALGMFDAFKAYTWAPTLVEAARSLVETVKQKGLYGQKLGSQSQLVALAQRFLRG